MRLRVALPADADHLGRIEAAAGERFRTIPEVAFVADHDPNLAPELLSAALAEDRIWVAVDLEGSVVGYALAMDLDGQPHLEQISVLPEWSGAGVGRALIAAVADWAATRSSSLTLATFRDVPWNAPLYTHLGWTALTEDEVATDPRLVAVREEEARHGLASKDRVFMRRPV